MMKATPVATLSTRAALFALLILGCSSPPIQPYNAVVWWAGAQQASDELESGLGASASIGGELIGDFSLLVRGRLAWMPGYATTRTELITEVGFLNFGGRFTAKEVLVGYGFHWLDSGDWGTGFSVGLGYYLLLNPGVRLELSLIDFFFNDTATTETTFGNTLEAAVMLGFRL
jgi:hypothetical protein